MIISQIMLTGLLVQWLRSQWKEEKESFRKDLSSKFMESVDQVMDSMLVKHLIVPVLNDSSVNGNRLFHYNKQISTNVTTTDSGRITAFVKDTTARKHTIISITIPDSSNGQGKENVVFSTFDSTEKNMLIRSVKLFINETGDTINKGDHFKHIISVVPDTSLLKKLFRKKTDLIKPGINIIWISDSGKGKYGTKIPMMNFRTTIFDKPINVGIVHYQRVLLRRITSQILFAFALLAFTGTAFFLMYKSLRKQELLNNLRNDFVSNISHELKTPVSTVTVALEALKNFDRLKEPEKSVEYIDIAFNEMKRLDQLISRVLNTSVLESHGEYLKTENADLVALTREVLNSMQARFEKSGAKVEFEHSSEVIIIEIDKLYIHGVLFNLLDNSLKYSSDKPEILIRISENPGGADLAVSDNGPGIPKEYISRIFDKFFRVPKGDVHNIKGYGLGLSFADLVMQHHSGSISVRNKAEGGCEFKLSFRQQIR